MLCCQKNCVTGGADFEMKSFPSLPVPSSCFLLVFEDRSSRLPAPVGRLLLRLLAMMDSQPPGTVSPNKTSSGSRLCHPGALSQNRKVIHTPFYTLPEGHFNIIFSVCLYIDLNPLYKVRYKTSCICHQINVQEFGSWSISDFNV